MGPDFDTGGQTPTLGYDRAAVDAFLVAAADERKKLEQEIEQSNLRLARARTALGTHRVMVAMLLETQRELSLIRRDAEREAAAIIAEAERDVRQQEQAHADGDAPGPKTEAIDLRNVDAELMASAPGSAVASSDISSIERDLFHSGGAEEEDYFAYLRGALSDDEPLGPRADDGGHR